MEMKKTDELCIDLTPLLSGLVDASSVLSPIDRLKFLSSLYCGITGNDLHDVLPMKRAKHGR